MTNPIKKISRVSDILFIESLSVDALIGVYDWERTQTQALIIDLEMTKDITQAANSDKLTDTLDYAAVSEALVNYISQTSFELLESLAEACVSFVVEEFSVTWLRLKIAKPGAIKAASSAGIIVERRIAPLGNRE